MLGFDSSFQGKNMMGKGNGEEVVFFGGEGGRQPHFRQHFGPMLRFSRVLSRAPLLLPQRAFHAKSRLLMPVNTVVVPTMGDSVSFTAKIGRWDLKSFCVMIYGIYIT